MKILRFEASTLELALHLVSKQLSADAVILETRFYAAKVEVVAALDADAAQSYLNTQSAPRSANKGSMTSNITRTTALKLLDDMGVDAIWSMHAIAELQDYPVTTMASALLATLTEDIPVAPVDSVLDPAVRIVAFIGDDKPRKSEVVGQWLNSIEIDPTRPVRMISLDTAWQKSLNSPSLAQLGVEITFVPNVELALYAIQTAPAHMLLLLDINGNEAAQVQVLKHLYVRPSMALQLRSYVLIPAHGDPRTLDNTINQNAAIPVSGCILTGLDHAEKLWPTLSVCRRRQLPICYLAQDRQTHATLLRPTKELLAQRAANLERANRKCAPSYPSTQFSFSAVSP